jgi:hypothetical protein
MLAMNNNGRPKQYDSDAARLKAWRAKQHETKVDSVETKPLPDETKPSSVETKLLPKPAGASSDDWNEACTRAARAKSYAEKLPEHVYPKEVMFQDPQWQYDHRLNKPKIAQST